MVEKYANEFEKIIDKVEISYCWSYVERYKTYISTRKVPYDRNLVTHVLKNDIVSSLKIESPAYYRKNFK